MLKHCHATAIEHRRGNSQRSLKSVNSPDNSSLNSSNSSSSGSSSTGSVNCSFVGSETSASSSFVLASPVSMTNTSSNIANTSINTSISSSAIPNTGNHPADSRRSSYSSPEPLSMASRTSSYASLSTTDGSLIHANGKICFYYIHALIFFSVKSKMSKFTNRNLIIQFRTRSEILMQCKFFCHIKKVKIAKRNLKIAEKWYYLRTI